MEPASTLMLRTAPKRVLIVRLSALGDVLHCLPALAAIRQSWPETTIDWVCEPMGASLIEGHPDLDHVIRFPRKEVLRHLKKRASMVPAFERGQQFVDTLRRHRYDLLLDLQGNLRSAVVSRLARSRRRVGHHRRETKEFSWALGGRRPSQQAGAVHRVEKNVHLIRQLGFHGDTPAGALPAYAEETTHLRAILGPVGPAPTLLHPFVSTFGRFKEWPGGRYAQLARSLAHRGHRVLITAAPEDDERRNQILELAGGSAERAPETRSTRELAALIRLSRGVIAADTGPLHLAAFAQVPVVGLFGPKDPEVYGPWSSRSAVRRAAVPCSPCRLRRCDHAICMTSISVSSVLAAVEDVFSKSRSTLVGG